MHTPDLTKLEQQTYRLVVDDGLLDVLIGLFIASFGFVVATDLDVMPVVVTVIAYPLWQSLRQRFVEPRVGYVRLHAERRAKMKHGKHVALLLFLGIVFAGDALLDYGTTWVADLRDLRIMLVVSAIGLPLAAVGVLLDVRRWLIYAMLLIVAGGVEYASGALYGLSLFVMGGAVVIGGFLLLTTFLDQHPPRTKPDYAHR